LATSRFSPSCSSHPYGLAPQRHRCWTSWFEMLLERLASDRACASRPERDSGKTTPSGKTLPFKFRGLHARRSADSFQVSPCRTGETMKISTERERRTSRLPNIEPRAKAACEHRPVGRNKPAEREGTNRNVAFDRLCRPPCKHLAEPLVPRAVWQGLEQSGDAHLFVQVRPVQLLAVQRDGKTSALRCCGCLQDRKPDQREFNGLPIGQVEKQVPAVEMHTYRSAVHGRLLNEKQVKDRPPQGAIQERMPESRTASWLRIFIARAHDVTRLNRALEESANRSYTSSYRRLRHEDRAAH
jgi:hypothetical protein